MTPEELAEKLDEYDYDWLLGLLNELCRDAAAVKALKRVAACEDNDGTAYPWWAICEPEGAEDNCYRPRVLVGPFFSRQSAEAHRQARLYDYGKDSYVYCFSAHYSREFRELYDASESLSPRQEKAGSTKYCPDEIKGEVKTD